MGSRERKREERRKRKRRSAESESFQNRASRRSEERNQAVRETLEPLAEGERPGAVKVAAAVSAVLSLIFTGSAVLALVTSIDVGGEEPRAVPLILFAVVLWAMTYGLWKARYWAVLGFQMLLVLFMLSSALGLIAVGNVFQAIGTLALLAGSAALFYFMIRAMARIQMPSRPAGPGEG